ncbi:MAG: tryptophan 7-halogenase [Verrucomicrobiales bacterium]|nr:tryptophan 7-halogenase [Verrucomicrobiales bacterium]
MSASGVMAVAAAYDAVIIGGGPGGSCVATRMAKAGRRVLVIEKERFPRFHVGESLLPYNHAIFEELGLLPVLEREGFPIKRGAQFHLGNGSKGTGFVFRQGCFTRHAEAFQVERARFDDVLLRHAATSGAEVREGVAVERVAVDDSGVTVTTRDSGDGTTGEVRGRFLIDASGRGNVTGNQEGLRIPNPSLRKIAIFGHFMNVGLDSGEKAGDTVIVRLDNKWFWLIPLDLGGDGHPSKVSVGLVLDRDELASGAESAETVFTRLAAANPPVAARLRSARRVSPMHVTGDFSYRNRSFFGPRVVRVGDAAGFIDPIFSSGVFLAMFSGRLAADAVLEALREGGDGTRGFAAYERRIRSAMRIYWEMVENFYTTPFMELFLEPRAKLNLAAAVNAVLAGELEGGWRLRWRMRVFFWLVKLQARFPLVPRISFAPAA